MKVSKADFGCSISTKRDDFECEYDDSWDDRLVTFENFNAEPMFPG